MNIKDIIKELETNPQELSKLLHVNIRTISRWIINPEDITGPAKQALLAWQKLHRIAMPWRPNAIDVGYMNPDYKPEDIIKNHITKQ